MALPAPVVLVVGLLFTVMCQGLASAHLPACGLATLKGRRHGP